MPRERPQSARSDPLPPQIRFADEQVDPVRSFDIVVQLIVLPPLDGVELNVADRFFLVQHEARDHAVLATRPRTEPLDHRLVGARHIAAGVVAEHALVRQPSRHETVVLRVVPHPPDGDVAVADHECGSWTPQPKAVAGTHEAPAQRF